MHVTPRAQRASKARKGVIRDQVDLFLLPTHLAAPSWLLISRDPGVPKEVGCPLGDCQTNLKLAHGFLPVQKEPRPRGASSDHLTSNLRMAMEPSAES